MKAEIVFVGSSRWMWAIVGSGRQFVESPFSYTRRRDAKRGLLRFLKGMKKGVEVVG